MSLNFDFKTTTIQPLDFSLWKNKIIDFLNQFLKTCPESHKKNYITENWETSESSLLKNIYIDRRYEEGCLFVVILNEQIVAFSAAHHFKNNVAILASRSCVLPGYEKYHLISTFLLPLQQQQFQKTHQYGVITFNTDPYSMRVMNSFAKRDRWTASKVNRIVGKQYFSFRFLTKATYAIYNCQQYIAYCCFSQISSETNDHAVLQQLN